MRASGCIQSSVLELLRIGTQGSPVNFFRRSSWVGMLGSKMGADSGISRRRGRTADADWMGNRWRRLPFTARSFGTERPRPFGAAVVGTRSGKVFLRALNNVAREWDPSAHAEVRAIRLATKKLKTLSLKGYTLYTTCEPSPMCMSTALWAGLDRVVYGATIEDANRHRRQIQIPAAEVVRRSDMTQVCFASERGTRWWMDLQRDCRRWWAMLRGC